MRAILAGVVFVAVCGAVEAAPSTSQLIRAFGVADSDCRGSANPDSVETQMECDRRSRIFGRLAQSGWCYGKKNQVGADFRWHKCTPQSIAVDDLTISQQP